MTRTVTDILNNTPRLGDSVSIGLEDGFELTGRIVGVATHFENVETPESLCRDCFIVELDREEIAKPSGSTIRLIVAHRDSITRS